MDKDEQLAAKTIEYFEFLKTHDCSLPYFNKIDYISVEKDALNNVLKGLAVAYNESNLDKRRRLSDFYLEPDLRTMLTYIYATVNDYESDNAIYVEFYMKDIHFEFSHIKKGIEYDIDADIYLVNKI